MIKLKDKFDYDTASVSITVTNAEGVQSDCELLVTSAFCEEAIKATSIYQSSIAAAKESGVELKEAYDNFGVELERDTEFAKNITAQYAESLVKDWPLKDEPAFDTLKANMTLCNVIINASIERGNDFLKKKKS